MRYLVCFLVILVVFSPAAYADEKLNCELKDVIGRGGDDVEFFTKILLDKGADPNGLCQGRSAISRTIHKNPGILKLLVDYGADINISYGSTYLYSNYLQRYKRECLQYKRCSKPSECLKVLLQSGKLADPQLSASGQRGGDSPLAYAFKASDYDLARVMLENGVSLYGRGKRGIAKGPVTLKTEYGDTPFMAAITNKRAGLKSLEILKEYGMTFNQEHLDLAMRYKWKEAYQFISDSIEE